ncbi:MAG: UDP-glucose 4-epimerase GalE [Puniceicoccales bacterium]|jgi:UDP-glucose 4-epimerase|nr:UDP-glucose 4-epimerase GalE [Puniceicoccales bacterium]
MNILVIGGSGYVGYHLVKALKSCGHRISVIDIVQVPSLLDYSISFYKGDAGDMRLVHDALNKEHVEMVVHAGGLSRADEAVAMPMRYYSNNVVGNIFLLNALLENNVKKIIYVSSAAVFGMQDKLPITDLSNRAPINPLGYSQLFFEEMLESFRITHGISYAVMRAPNLAGLSNGEHKHFVENLGVGLIPSIIECALGKCEKVDIYGTSYPTIDGTAARDYLHVDDFCDACVNVMPHLEVRREKQVFNVGLGKAISVKEVIQCAQEVIGKTIVTEDFPEREGDADRTYFDSFRTRTALDWRPKYETLKDIIFSIWKNFELSDKGA